MSHLILSVLITKKTTRKRLLQWVHAMNLMANRFLDEVSLTEQPSSSVMNIVDQEEIDPPQDTTMLIWDPDLIMPSDDLFESQESPVEVLVVKT
jgi:hypothetical protein